MGTLQRIVSFSLLLSVVLTGCTKKGQDKQAQEEPPAAALTIEPLVGIGPVRFGASREEIARSFGPPDRQATETDLNYVASKGLAFEMSPQGGLEKIKCWSDRMPVPPRFPVATFAGTTKEGIGMGTARERIVAAYGPPDKTDARGDIENLSYNKLCAKFTLWQGAVTSIILEAPQ
jgi:hypothetical protein